MIEKIRQFILRKRVAYRTVFTPGGEMTIASKAVLADLRRFCRGAGSPAQLSQISGMVDPMATGIAIGRQEVWLRIQQNIHMSDADLYRLVESDAERDQ